MAPPKQSNFVEGSMNDRVSAVPPADFLREHGGGDGDGADYESQFAMHWKAPELQFGRDDAPGNPRRSSFMSVRSGVSALTTRTGAAKPSPARGLLGKVKEKLRKSRSSWTVGGDDERDDGDDDGGADSPTNASSSSSFLAHFPIPPVFKHTRSDSMDRQRGRTSDGHPTSDFGVFQRDAAAAHGRPLPPPRADSLSTILPSTLDPTKRPTREEIAANYQSLLASGFFGTHAIQSTRFSPPGSGLHQRSGQGSEGPSYAQRLAEKKEEEERSQVGAETSLPPSPMRQPPPVPSPSREAPPPPAPTMDMDMDMEVEQDEASDEATPKGILASATAVFHPLPPLRTSSLGADTTMSPPPIPKQLSQRSAHKTSLSFSAIPYSSTRPGIEPTLTQRPFRPPPVALARFSVDSSRPRSLDVQTQRGTKRPFSKDAANVSQTSFYTDRTSYDYDPMAMDGHGGIGLATTTASPEKVESGARKFVKRLKKSASKLSFGSQSRNAIFKAEENNTSNGDFGAELQQPPSRTSLSSNVKRSFSWRLGSGSSSKLDATTPSETPIHSHYHHHSSISVIDQNFFGGGVGANNTSETFSLNNDPRTSSMDDIVVEDNDDNDNDEDPFFQPVRPHAPLPVLSNHAPPAPLGVGYRGLATIAASPAVSPSAATTTTTTDRNRLKKREIRSRRLRRTHQEATAIGSPLRLGAEAGTAAAYMDGPMSPVATSPSKRRPRRSDASILMRVLDSSKNEHDGGGDNNDNNHNNEESEPQRPNVGAGDDDDDDGGGDAMDQPSAAPSDGMEGVEFSFHFPGRMRPTASRSNTGSSSIHGHGHGHGGVGGGAGGPLVVVPHVNRGLPPLSTNALGRGFPARKTGSVRVVRAE